MSFFTITEQEHYFFSWKASLINNKVAMEPLVADWKNEKNNFGHWRDAWKDLVKTAEFLGCFLKDVEYETRWCGQLAWKFPIRIVFEKNGETLTITNEGEYTSNKWVLGKSDEKVSSHTEKAIRENTMLGSNCICKKCIDLRKKYFPEITVKKCDDYIECPNKNPYTERFG